ncbi:MAG: 5'/3'-nucleotidase SurE [Cyanothece sp. SIO2G6]|nr:5'/3'-nucleotidase SurE [Cyanothece sp. SIO2G6]
MMKLLVSNDDGIFAKGIRTLANTLAAAGHEVTVVCPDRERSATGHGLTLHKPIRAEHIESVFDSAVQAWACSGTPSDCVKLALGAILDSPPALVLSGINHGPNLGTDVLYSGTVSAAMEGLIENVSGIAFSLASFSAREFQGAANFAKTLVDYVAQHPPSEPMLLNVNVPAIAEPEIAGVQLTRQGIRRYVDLFEKRVDPRGKTYYWLAGEVVETDDGNDLDNFSKWVQTIPHTDWWSQTSTDVQAVRNHFISITPLQYNLTHVNGLANLQHWRLHFPI